jgi:hypothetical protein
MPRKVFVDVVIKVDKDGNTRPLFITWEDGHRYEVDKLKDVRRAAATKVGGGGIRYTIMVSGKETHIFNDDGKWFVEANE